MNASIQSTTSFNVRVIDRHSGRTVDEFEAFGYELDDKIADWSESHDVFGKQFSISTNA